MKKIIITLSAILMTTGLFAQQLLLNYGRTMSQFNYSDSEGNSLNLNRMTKAAIGIGYRMPIAPSKFFLNTSLNYNQYGASGSDPVLNNYYRWDVDYVGIQAQVDYEFFKAQNYFVNKDGFSLYVKGGFAAEFLVQGTQRINNDLYNLIGVEQFDKPIVFLRGGIGGSYCVSHKLSIFIEYNGGQSLFGKSSGDGEKLTYTTHGIGFGLMLSLNGCNYCNHTL